MSAQIIYLDTPYRRACRQVEEAIAEIKAIAGRTEEKRERIEAILRTYDHLPSDSEPQEVPFQ